MFVGAGDGTIRAEFHPATCKCAFEAGWLNPFFPGRSPAGLFRCARSIEGMAFRALFGTGLGQAEAVPGRRWCRGDFIPEAASARQLRADRAGDGAIVLDLTDLIHAARGLRAGIRVRDPFSQALAGPGLASIFGCQVFSSSGGVTQPDSAHRLPASHTVSFRRGGSVA